jgi:hypothetical protein
LKGKRELTLPFDATDPDKSRRLCEDDPLFVYDPNNDSNRPVPGEHDPLLNFWPIYPASLRKLFMRAFTAGLGDPDGRVMENEWRKEMCAMLDSIFYCPCCTAENFFDLDLARQKKPMNPCWGCNTVLANPPRMRLGGAYDAHFVVLSPGTELFSHHLEGDTYNFSAPLAQVVANPLGLRNLSANQWTSRTADGTLAEVLPGQVLSLASDCRVNFGRAQAEVRVG